MQEFEWNLNNNNSVFNNSMLLSSLHAFQQNYSKTLHLILIVLYAIIFVIGFISNILVIYFVLLYKRMQTMTNKFLTNLAVADLLAVLICVPVNMGHLYSPHGYIFGEIICKFSPFIQGVSVSVSILTLTIISADRYYIIYKPFKARVSCTNKRIKLAVSIIWLVSLFIMSPLLIVNKLENRLKPLGIDLPMCVEDWPYFESRLVYDSLQFLILFVLPIIFITYAYVTISHVLWNVEENLIVHSGYNKLSVNKSKVKLSNNLNNIETYSLKPSASSQIKSQESNKPKLISSFNSCKDINKECIELRVKMPEHRDLLQPAGSLNSVIGGAAAANMNRKSSSNEPIYQYYSRCQTNAKELPKYKANEYARSTYSIASVYTQQRKSMRVASQRSQFNNLIQSRRRIVKLLIVLVFLFVISLLPYHLITLLIDILHYMESAHDSKEANDKLYVNLSEYVHPITLCLALANSASNPVCYCILSHGFRKMFQINFFKFKKAFFGKNKSQTN